jgi:inosine/xanthosine triphosphatase
MAKSPRIVAVGSTRLPKLNAVREAVASFALLLGPSTHFDVEGFEVASGVADTPVSRVELMRGARQRAEALIAALSNNDALYQSQPEFFVGVEGGLDVVDEPNARRVFLESWAYVTDGRSGHFGCSGSIELPEALAAEVLDHGIDLSVAIDAFAGAVGIRDGKGAWGVLSSNLISRQDSFRLAVIAAFAPFYNARMYTAAQAAAR